MSVTAPMDEAALRQLIRRELGNLPELVRQLQGSTAGWSPEWVTPSFQPGWSSFAGWPVGVARSPQGLVMLRGLLSNTFAPAMFEHALTLPAGYRPGDNVAYPTVVNDNPEVSRLTVTPDGRLLIGGVPTGIGAGAWWTLNAVVFWAGD